MSKTLGQSNVDGAKFGGSVLRLASPSEAADLEAADGADGSDGSDGAAAGFGTPTATTGTIGITASGPDTAKIFAFSIPAGAAGADGADGADGAGHDVIDESGSALTTRTKLTLIGELVEATDNDPSTDITIDAKTAWLYG